MWLIAQWNWALDGWIVLAGILCAVSASLLGNFLVLRRMSLLGDAISHAVLPGLAAAFLISGSRSGPTMFLGAVLVGVLTAALTEWIRSSGKVDEGASMGVVFTALFAIGLVMIVRAADHVDLDPGCVLYGAIELTPLDTVIVGGFEIPRVVVTQSIVLVINILFVTLLFKELMITSFTPALAASQGISPTWMHYLLMTLVAVTSVASFESVGNILVVAMFVVPPATAYLCTDRLGKMIALSTLFAASSAVLGHLGALTIPTWFGYRSTTTAGMMAVSAGGFFLLATLAAPRHGILPRALRHWSLGYRIATEDIVALIYRYEEQSGRPASVTRQFIREELLLGRLTLHVAIRRLLWAGEISPTLTGYELTDVGRRRAGELVRSHRLWEQYLVTTVGVEDTQIHPTAERLEHFTSAEMRRDLDEETRKPTRDPHGSPIPPEATADDE